MRAVLVAILAAVSSSVRSRAALEVEILALRHQITVLQRAAPKRPRLTRTDRLLWVWLSQTWRDWRAALTIVKPETVIAWHRKGFRLFCLGGPQPEPDELEYRRVLFAIGRPRPLIVRDTTFIFRRNVSA